MDDKPEQQHPRTIAIDIYQDGEGFEATIGNGWIRCGGKTEYEAALRALTDLDGQLDGISSLKARHETVERLEMDLKHQLHDLMADAVQDLMPTIEAEVRQRFPTATVTLIADTVDYLCFSVVIRNSGLDPDSDEAYRWTAEVEQKHSLDPLRCFLTIY